MLLFYVRHGDPIYDPDTLTEFGKEQAKALSKRFALFGLDEIYSSDSERAMLTATPTAKALNLPIIKAHWAHESLAAWEFNAFKKQDGWAWCFEHIPTVKLFCSKEIKGLGYEWYNYNAFNHLRYKEGILRVNKEADKFLKQFGLNHDRENRVYYKCKGKNLNKVALFAHSGFGRAFLSSILDIPYPEFCTHFDMGTSGVTVIDFKEYDGFIVPKVLQYSNDSHIYKEELDTSYNKEYKF